MGQQQRNIGIGGSKRRKVISTSITFGGGETSINQPAPSPAGAAGFSSSSEQVVWIAKVRSGGTAGNPTDRNVYGLEAMVEPDGSLWLKGALLGAASPGTVLIDLIQL